MFIVCQIAKTLFEGYANSSHSDALLFDQRHVKRGTRTFTNYLKSVHLDLFIYFVYFFYELRSKLYAYKKYISCPDKCKNV